MSEAIPVAEHMARGRPADGVVLYDEPSRWGRREVLALAFRASVFAGLTMLGLFRSVRRAGADFPYRAHRSCGAYDPDTWNGFDGNDNGWFEPGTCNDDVCIGAPDDAMGSWYCVRCSEVSASNPYGWHFKGFRGEILYGDATDVCTVNGVARDAWQWQVSSCAGCTPAVFRCHDGWKLAPNGDLISTVCQALVTCTGRTHAPCR